MACRDRARVTIRLSARGEQAQRWGGDLALSASWQPGAATSTANAREMTNRVE